MGTTDRAVDRGRRNAQSVLRRLGTDLHEARLAAGVSQSQLAAAAGVSQSTVSRIELAQAPQVSLVHAARLSAALGYRTSLQLYPEGSPVRDAGQLRLIERLRLVVHPVWGWSTEMLVGTHGDQRAWDVWLSGPGTVAIDAETRLYDLQALQRRCEAKGRDSGADRMVLLVSRSRHNLGVLRDHREALRSTFTLDTRPVLAALRSGRLPPDNGIVVM